MDDKLNNRIFSVKDVSAMCHVSNETIRRWIKKNNLKAYNTAAGLAIKIIEADLRDFSEKNNIYVDWDSL